MSFQISPDVDGNKVFLVRSSEIEGRFDPNFISISRRLKGKFNSSQFEFVKFGTCIDYIQYGISSLANKEEKGVPIVRMNNLKGDEWNFSDIKHIELSEAELNNYKLSHGDLLFNRTNSKELVGKCGVFKETGDWVFASYLIRVRTNEKLLPDFASFFLGSSIGRLQIDCLSRQIIGMTNINAEEIKLIQVPLPPHEIQSAIVAKMDAAYAAKKEKETEAERLLNSIDDYLLRELGIELPEQEENTVQSRIFTRRFSEISGGRFDAPIYQKRYLLESSKYPMEKMRDCVQINPVTSFHGYPSETFVSFIPMEKVSDQYGEADISDYRKIEESGGYTKFQDNDLLWAKITPCMQNGKSAVVTGLRNGIGFGSTEFHVFRAKPDVDIRYIYGLLRLLSLRKYAVLYFSGSAGHQRVSDEFFKRLNIPLPPLPKQTEIADHITQIRNRAKQLRQEAKQGLEQAKQEVEAMILGEDHSGA